MPLKIMHAVLSMDVGGLERVVLELVREGQLLGQQVSVACLESPGILGSEVEALGARLICLEKRPGIRVGLVPRLAKIMRQIRPDVMHSHQIGVLFYAGPAARRAGVPVIVHTQHNSRPPATRRRRWLARFAGRHAARFFCVNRDGAQAVIDGKIAAREKLRVIPNGIDLSLFQGSSDDHAVRRSFGIPPDVPLIGTIGRLTDVKRQDLLIRGFQKARAILPDAHLLIVGDGPLLPELRKLTQILGLSASVHFAGYQPQPHLYLKAMDVFALTSRSEGMPLVVLEAWAAGVPVVAAKVGGLPEMIDNGHTGCLFPTGDESALAAALIKTLGDPIASRAMAEAGRCLVEITFTTRQMAQAYQEQYLELLQSSEAQIVKWL